MRGLVAFFGTGVLALSIAVASATGINRPQTFSLLEIDESDQGTIINGFEFQRLPVAGDRFAFRSGLYKWAGAKRGARIGRDQGLCTFIRVPSGQEHFTADADCSASFFLPAGSIAVSGVIHLSEGPARFDIPVIGGTRG